MAQLNQKASEMTNHIIYQKASEMTNQKYFNALVRGGGERRGSGGPRSPRGRGEGGTQVPQKN